VSRAELALRRDGTFLALRVNTLANLGAYATFVGALVPGEGAKIATTVYRIPILRSETDIVLTNTAPTGPYRGAGRPEVVYLIERLVDRAAHELGIDPVALRRKNLIAKAEMPFTTPTGSVYDSGDFARLLDRAREASGWDDFAGRRAAAAARGRLLGRGIAYYVDKTGSNAPTEHVEIVVGADGSVTILSATQAMGQGLETSYTQLAAARFGIAPSRVRIVQGDTDAVPVGAAGSGGSRSLFIGGSAIVVAAGAAIEEGRGLAAQALEADPVDIEYREGRFLVAGTDRAVTLADAAQRSGGTLRVGRTLTVDAMSWPNGCHASEVEIDPETGVVKIVRFVAVDDVGVVIHPPIVHGQVQGGIAQGVGQALLEDCRYDGDSGQLLTGSFLDYALPRADDLPPTLHVATDESSPCLTNPLGAKGAGEGGSIGAPAAIVNAVLDALRDCGVDDLQMPIRSEAVWRSLRGAGRT
jgi:carbon-monoxide dehydrogenase large subunit